MEENYINIKSCFIGPKGENKEMFLKLLNKSFQHSIKAREDDNCDATYFDNEHFKSDQHIDTLDLIEENLDSLSNYLKKSLQFSSFKYHGHMVGDNLIPAILGNTAALLYNQSALSNQFGNKITFIEMAACNDLCTMIGFNSENISKNIDDFSFTPITRKKEIENLKKEIDFIKPFSHITTGGSTSNIESMWCSFFVKCLPIAIKNAILNDEFKILNDELLKVLQYSGDLKILTKLSNWELLNLNNDFVVNLPYKLSIDLNIPFKKVMSIIKKYHISNLGLYKFCKINEINAPVAIAPASIHYSISKAAILLGIGVENLKSVNVDENARMDIIHLKEILNECKENKIPVINIISMLGSTQESAVDNLHEILLIRENFRTNFNFSYDIHVDGAHGSYFISMVRDNFQITNPPDQIIFKKNNKLFESKDSFDPTLICSKYLLMQLNSVKYADTVTVDPHKTGFVPYSCGAICFRNSKYKDILINSGEYLAGTTITSVGMIGIEGSRAGSAATSLYLVNSIIRPSKIGYGYILKKCLLNTKLFYFKLLQLEEENQDLINISFTFKPIKKEKYQLLKSKLLKPNGELIDINEIESNYILLSDLSDISSDLTVFCFCFNFKVNGILNNDYELYKSLNNTLISEFNHLPEPNDKDLILTSTIFHKSHGPKFISNIIKSIGLKDIDLNDDIYDLGFPFLRATIMNPFISDAINGNYLNEIIKIIYKKLLIELKYYI